MEKKIGSYKSEFVCSNYAYHVMRKGKILSGGETPRQMIGRVIAEIVQAEVEFFGSSIKRAVQFENEIGQALDSHKIIFSTPVLTNAGRKMAMPLSACVVPPIDLNGDFRKIKTMIDAYHQEAIGTGFNFDEVEDPVAVMNFLNEVAVKGSKSGKESRPVGNMGILSVDHPYIKEFVMAKAGVDKEWKFNISINVTSDFIHALKKKAKYSLKNGKEVYAEEIFNLMAAATYLCGDPGLIFMERLNKDNPVPSLGHYTAVAPCAEVGLAPGESCQFGYLNLGAFVSSSTGHVDLEDLVKTTAILVRALDNALEVSISRFSVKRSSEIMRAKRKIGLGVCGLADMLARLGVGYDSEIARKISRDIISLINYKSKRASVELGKERGSFLAFSQSRYVDKPGFIEDKYEGLESSYVSRIDWVKLAERIREKGLLRNCSTVSLPPTGRSGLVIDASLGVEPFFNLSKGGNVIPLLIEMLQSSGLDTDENLRQILERGSCQRLVIPEDIKKIFKTATEIHPQDHLRMVGEIQPCVDEAISKTINLPNHTTIEEIKEVFFDAFHLNLKGITVYINSRNRDQPIKLASS